MGAGFLRDLILGGCLAGFLAVGGEVLFDFERDAEGWHGNQWRVGVERSREHPVQGAWGLRFVHPRWCPEEHGGKHTWPSMETRTVRRDWSGFDRLAVPVYNGSVREMALGVLVTDSRIPLRKGFSFLTRIPPRTLTQLTLPFAEAFRKKGVDASDVAMVHVFSEDPPAPMAFHLDRIMLLRPGEEAPPLPPEMLADLERRRREFLAPFLKRIDAEAPEVAARLDGVSGPAREFLRRRLADYLRAVHEDRKTTLSEHAGGAFLWEQIRRTADAAAAFEAVRARMTRDPSGRDVVLGYAGSMEKVFPRCPGFAPLPETVTLSAAGGEHESFQLVVMPTAADRARVGIEPSEFRTDAGDVLPRDAFSAAPVGFVETKRLPVYRVRHVGWHSDPLLTFLKEVEVRRGDAQPFWIRVHVPAGQRPGIYGGEVRARIEGRTVFAVPVRLRVYGFTLPKACPLALAISFNPSTDRRILTQAEVDAAPGGPQLAWKRHAAEWADMLADYGITRDNLYYFETARQNPWTPWEPDFETLLRLKRQGRLGRFNLGYFQPASTDPADLHGMGRLIGRIRPRYEKARRLGILDHAYLYGCDEAAPDRFPQVERAAAILKREFPGVPILTTTYDPSYGVDGSLPSIDWFCPHTFRYSPAQADKARRLGRKVWYYICAGPEVFPNNYLESDAMEPRLITGAMAAKFRPDGFLYYSLALWNSLRPITSGPYTAFNPESYLHYHGDGMWVYPGPDATPIPSIRLENFRDGLEDLAYFRLLQRKLESLPPDSPRRKPIRAALQVPPGLVGERTTDVSLDYEALLNWRNRLAELLEK